MIMIMIMMIVIMTITIIKILIILTLISTVAPRRCRPRVGRRPPSRCEPAASGYSIT